VVFPKQHGYSKKQRGEDMTAGPVYSVVLVVSGIAALYFISRSLRSRSAVTAGKGERDDEIPAGGVQLGRRFNPETGYLDTVDTDKGINPNPNTTSGTLKETMEAQKQNPPD
jgi:hypothetical protein